MNFGEQFDDITQDLWQNLSQSKKPVVLYGMGDGAEKIIDVLNKKGLNVSAVFASDGFVRKKVFRGHTVESYSSICEKFDDFTVLVSFGTKRPEVIDNIINISHSRELYAPDVPVFGGGLFDLEYFGENFSRLERIYERLCDNISKKAFVCSIKYRLTGKIDYLFECETAPEESYLSVLRPYKDCVYIDVGAYNGDTVKEFSQYSGTDITVHAIEPDSKNFKKLSSYADLCDIKKIKLHNAAAWNENGYITFYSRSGRNSANTTAHKESVKAEQTASLMLDSIAEHADYIKIDAEGADKNALLGAKHLISQKNSPSLCVAAYHRTEDYFEIPECVFNINENYKLYFRHFRHIPCWDTNFYFIKE